MQLYDFTNGSSGGANKKAASGSKKAASAKAAKAKTEAAAKAKEPSSPTSPKKKGKKRGESTIVRMCPLSIVVGCGAYFWYARALNECILALLGKKKGVSALAARMGLDPSKMMRGVGGASSRPKQPEPTVFCVYYIQYIIFKTNIIS